MACARLSDQSSDEAEEESYPTYGEIFRWKKAGMADWLKDRSLAKSGTKAQLANRIYKAMRYNSNSSSSDSDGASATESALQTAESLTDGWQNLAEGLDLLPHLTATTIDNYCVFQKDPVCGKIASFQRRLSKAKTLSNENYVLSVREEQQHERTTS